ncbi:MAG: VWA domain-containing protein [Bacilli bacterium]|nr:VWA domain-containing protein [Bacilli bacterium]
MGKYAGDDDLVVNTSVRVPVCLCLDISGSMRKNDAIDELNKGIEAFYNSVRNDEQSASSCEIAIVTFADEVEVREDFSLIERKEPIHIDYVPNGGTALAHGVMKCLELLDARKQEYKDNGVEYFQPWLLIITDGKPGDVEDVPAAQAEVKARILDKKLTLFPIAVGSDEDPEKSKAIMEVLNGFSPAPKAIHLRDLKFEEFFEWLGRSVSIVSQADQGDKVTLDKDVSGWLDIDV